MDLNGDRLFCSGPRLPCAKPQFSVTERFAVSQFADLKGLVSRGHRELPKITALQHL